MSDTEPCAQLLQSYGALFDARDAAGFADLFTEGAVVVAPGGREIVGRERIARMVERTPPGGEHRIGNPELLERTATMITTRTNYSATMPDGSDGSGTYSNTFSLVADGWRISHHTIVPDE